MFYPVNYTCIPPPDTFIIDINPYNRGFPSQFLITQWWAEFPTLQTLLYVFGFIQLAAGLAGVILAVGRNDQGGLTFNVIRKLIPFNNHLWQIALAGMILFLPTQWLSNITMGMILFHSWAEFLSLVLRFMVVRQQITGRSIQLFYKWAVITAVITAIPFMLGSNPYVQGIITTVLVFPADFLNLVIAPYLTKLFINSVPNMTTSERVSHILLGTLNVVHVIWFYGQGILACTVSVETGATFFICLQATSTTVYVGYILSYAIDIHETTGWQYPMYQFLSIFDCTDETQPLTKSKPRPVSFEVTGPSLLPNENPTDV